MVGDLQTYPRPQLGKHSRPRLFQRERKLGKNSGIWEEVYCDLLSPDPKSHSRAEIRTQRRVSCDLFVVLVQRVL